jgi:E3 ubiquitin-protein ligase BRE1
VELVGSLLDSLAALGKPAVPPPPSGGEEVDARVEHELRDMKRAASMISQRSITLQKWLWTLLQRVNTPERHESILQTAELNGQVASLKSQCRDLEARIAELVTTRDEAVSSDRKVRRGLYRLAAGRMNLDEVLKAVEDEDKDGAAAMMAMEVAEEVASSTNPVVSSAIAPASGEPEEGEVVDGAQVVQLKKQLQDLEEIASSRESQIEQLLKEREENSKRINSLSLSKSSDRTTISDEDVKRSSLYTETATKLVTVERQLAELRTRMETLSTKYATAKGDAELATKTLDEHMKTFKKRWAELSGGQKAAGDYDDLYDDAEKDDRKKNGARLLDSTALAKRTVELEHKLKQALENVRQADMVRVSLSEAQTMNETLLQQLEEFKAKYASVMANRTASRASSETALSSKDKPITPVSAEKAEKLHRENRKMKKELANAVLGKESAKAKQDKAEKERDDLLETNARLLKQNMEKDDMNAKSLSTILHLKSLTEQAEKEKEAREQEAKSYEQVSLAARLAENAKERVAEEALKEKKVLEDKVGELEKECERVKREKEVADGTLAQTMAEMSSLEKSVGTMKDRSEELASESAKLQEEKRKLMESLAVAQREAAEAAKKVMHLRASSGGGGGDSGFTADQLETQVSVLKSRLACPVCNHRDKECILLRCRHMFCKPCVEENVKNRSRKCPACGQRFDNKDVHDVWL